jgi:hypothetical protein
VKQGKNPTRAQKILLRKKRMNPADWLVERDTPEKLVLRHRHFDTVTKTIYKGETHYD